MSNLFWWMKNDTSIIKAYWFYIPRLNVLFNVLIAVVFCEHRCRTCRWNALDATSVAGTQVH